jgi:hypothetical protein
MLSHTQHQQQQYDNPFARSEDTFDFYQEDRTIEPDVDLTGQSSTKQQQAFVNPFANLRGSIGSAVPSSSSTATAENTDYNTAYTGEDTLDEPVSVTIVRSYISTRFCLTYQLCDM